MRSCIGIGPLNARYIHTHVCENHVHIMRQLMCACVCVCHFSFGSSANRSSADQDTVPATHWKIRRCSQNVAKKGPTATDPLQGDTPRSSNNLALQAHHGYQAAIVCSFPFGLEQSGPHLEVELVNSTSIATGCTGNRPKPRDTYIQAGVQHVKSEVAGAPR